MNIPTFYYIGYFNISKICPIALVMYFILYHSKNKTNKDKIVYLLDKTVIHD